MEKWESGKSCMCLLHKFLGKRIRMSWVTIGDRVGSVDIRKREDRWGKKAITK